MEPRVVDGRGGSRGGNSFRLRAIGAIVLMLAAVFLASCGGGGQEEGAQQENGGAAQETGGQSPQEATLEEIVNFPDQFYGKNVTVTGAVGQFIEPQGLVIISEQDLEEIGVTPTAVTPEGVPTPQLSTVLLDEGVVVVSKSSMDAPKRQSVRVTGMVRQFDRAVVGQEVGFELRSRYYGGWRNKPAIVATSVEQIGGGGEATSLENTDQMQETTGQ